MKKSQLGLLLFLVLASAGLRAETGAAISGVYGELTVGVDPQNQSLSGYYQNGTGSNGSGGSQFSCLFYLVGKKQGAAYAIQTWFPGDGKKEVIAGELRFISAAGAEPASVQLKLKQEPGGCGMVDPDLASTEGSRLIQDAAGQWKSVRVVSAKRAHFFESPDAIAPRKTYVVQGDALRVWDQKPGWVQADFEGKNKGWVKETDLFPAMP
ncbi:MAG: hypothetical protein K8R69_03805 [Deltaproteobacteria bacterium]|nr:hypothetical protein [Deltaproteobacteria bacterium]